MTVAVGFGLVWLGLFFVVPALSVARLCADRVLLVAPDKRAAGWKRVNVQLIFSAAVVATFVGFGAVMGAATATAGEGARVVNNMLFNSGAFLALLGWFAPVTLTGAIEGGLRLNYGTLSVRLSPLPFAALAGGSLVRSTASKALN